MCPWRDLGRRMGIAARAVALAAILAPSGSCQDRRVDVRVEADLFSGRPNPAWTLSSGEATELARRLEKVEARRGEPAPVGAAGPGLGYRGLVVSPSVIQ